MNTYTPYKCGGDAMRFHRRRILLALLQLGAVDEATRRRCSDVADHLDGPRLTRRSYKLWMARLVHAGMIEALRTNRGGYWITSAGRKFILDDLRSQLTLIGIRIDRLQQKRSDLGDLLNLCRKMSADADAWISKRGYYARRPSVTLAGEVAA